MIVSPPLDKLPDAPAIARQVKLSDAARALLNDRQRPDQYLSLLRREELYADAIRVMAICLTSRVAVWWGCLCLWEVYRTGASAEETAAMQAALKWVLDPVDAHRRAAGVAARAAGPGTPAGSLALAAFYSGGSMAPPGAPEVAPKPILTPKAVAAAVLAASRKAPSKQVAAGQRRFLERVQEMSAERAPWENAAAR